MRIIDRLNCLLKKNDFDCLSMLLTNLKKHNDISGSQLNMIHMMLKLSQIQVREVMVPRANMHTINVEDSKNAICEKIKQARHSRYPVTTDNKDEIVGILLAKNILIKDDAAINQLCIKPFFVPESKRLDILLREFQRNHNHMAIVKDEYNGVAGLITLEDVIEEVLGEIEDEDFSFEEKLSIKQLTDCTFLVSGRVTLAELNESTGIDLKSDIVDTIGGYIAKNLGYFPKSKSSFELNGLKFKIEHADAKNIKSIKITKPIDI